MESAMHNEKIWDLADCTEFRQTLQVSPPAIVHGTLILLAVLFGTALLWLATTRADLVVRGSGRTRPLTSPLNVIPEIGGRIITMNFREGQTVQKDDILLTVDTARLDIEI